MATGGVTPAAVGGPQPSNYSLGKTLLNFQETPGAGTYTATFAIPAGAMIGDVRCYVVAGPWDATTKVLNAGDNIEPQGFIKNVPGEFATDELSGSGYDPTVLDNNLSTYLSWATGASAATDYNQNYAMGTDNKDGGIPYPSGGTFTATLVTTGAGGSTGHWRIEVFGYGLPASTINAVKS